MVDIEQPDQLTAYLHARGIVAADEQPNIRVLTGGVANKTVLVEHRAGGLVIKQALGKFRVKVDWFVQPERSALEALGLRTYEALLPAGSTPRFLFEDFDNFIHAMTAIPQPHETLKRLLLSGQGTSALIERFAALMAESHLRALEQADTLRPQFASLEYFETQRLEPFYAYTAAQVPEAADLIHALIEETRRTQLTLVHADFTPKNVLVLPDGQLVLLDYEIVHWGDPAFDVGLALAHLIAKAIKVETRRADYPSYARLFGQTYLDQVADTFGDLEGRIVRHTLACVLARVRGRSPLEYFDEPQRAAIAARVVQQLKPLPPTLDALIDALTLAL
ncbi:MAG: phosphotransferase [Anaerolinea sp.]